MTKKEVIKFIQLTNWKKDDYKKNLLRMQPLEIAAIVSHTISLIEDKDKEEYLSIFISNTRKPEEWDSYLEINSTNYPRKDSYSVLCHAKNCMYTRECAQHETAGDFRSEDGMTPDIVNIDGYVSCNKTEPSDKSTGMIYLSSHGEIKHYPSRYDVGAY